MTPPPSGREPTGPDADGSHGPGRSEGARPGDGARPADPDATTWLRADAISGGPVPGADPDPSPVLAPPADPPGDEKHDPSLNKLSSTLQKGAAISAVVLVATQVLSLVQAVVTARLLSPIEIGAFTLGTTFCNYLTTLAGGGMKAALIQRGKDVEDAANTAFWASLASGVAMGGIAFATAPLLGSLFPDPKIPPGLVTMIAAITCGTLLVHALLNVPEALMQRQFNFKRKLIVDPLTSISFTIVAIVGAIAGWGVWALVAALYASQISTLIASWTLARWFPGKGRFRYRIWREMAQFSFPLILQGVSAQIRDSAQPTIVGRLLGADPVGQFRYGKRIGVLPGNAIIQIASYVLFPAFSRIADDAVRFRRGFLRALRLLWTVTLPLGVLLAAVGGPAIVVLLGPEWAPAGVFVAAMAGFGPGTAMNAVSVESIKGAGRSRLIHWVTGTSLVVGLGGLVLFIALGMGLLGVGLAVSLEALAAGALTLALARPIVGATWSELGRTMVPPILAALTAGAATAALEHLVLHSATRSIPVGLLFLVTDSVAFIGVYVAIMLVVAPATIREIVDLVSKFRRRGSGGEEAPAAVGDSPDGPQDLVGARDRRGEDYLLDAPTIVLALWGDPETQRLGSYPPSPPRRPAGPPPPPRPGPPPGPGAPGPAPFAPPRYSLPEHARPTEAMRTTERRPAAPPDGARPPGAPPAPANGHPANGHPANGHPANGHASNGHASNGHASNGHPSNGHTPDGTEPPEPAGAGGPGGKAAGRRRRMVPMTQKPPRRPRR